MSRSTTDKPPPRWRVRRAGDLVDPNVLVLVPADEEATRRLASYRPTDEIAADVRRPRNVKHHRKFWTLLTLVAENSDAFETPEQVLYAVKAAMGRGKWVSAPRTKKPFFVPESVSFATMDQVEFETFYSAAVNTVLKFWLPIGREDLEREVASRY